MSKSIIRAYTAWWPEEGVTTYAEAKECCLCELWIEEYMRSEQIPEKDIDIVRNLKEGESHRIHMPADLTGPAFDVVIEYEGETYEDSSYQFETERECHHLNWREVRGLNDCNYEDADPWYDY